MNLYEQALDAARAIEARAPLRPTVAVVLGSGLGAFADRAEGAVVLPYDALPHWPPATVVGHAGRLVIGRIAGCAVALLAGRAHSYEGHSLARVTFPTRVLRLLGATTLIVTNAAGGINPAFQPGTLMVIDDHLNLMGANPLVGPNDERFGPRFPDMTEAYSRRLRALADEVARARGLPLRHGIYAAVAGPSYETPAEIRALRTLGADAVGMSTVPEVIVARHMGMDVLGLSCITNLAAGVAPHPLRHEEVLETARRVSAQFAVLLEGILERISGGGG